MEDVLINNGESYQTIMQHAGDDLSLGAELHLYYDENIVTVNDLFIDNPEMSLSYSLDIPGEIHIHLTKSGNESFYFADENLINIEFTATSNGLLSQAFESTQARNSYLLDLEKELVILNLEVVNQIDTGNKDILSHHDIFKVYPNPASDNITFDFLDDTPNNLVINIYDIRGQLVSQHLNKNNIDVSSRQIEQFLAGILKTLLAISYGAGGFSYLHGL